MLADLNPKSGERARLELEAIGPTCAFVAANVADAAEVRRLVETAVEKFGRLDILVNNAGLQHVSRLWTFPKSAGIT